MTGPRIQFASRGAMKRLAVLFAAILVALVLCWWFMIRMPGTSFSGPLPALTSEESSLAAQLRADVEMLAETIGPRNRMMRIAYRQAGEFIESRLIADGLSPQRLPCPPRDPTLTPGIIVAEIVGATRGQEIVVVGAHYDSFDASPGANDNGTGVAAVLALAASFAGTPDGTTASPPARTIRFVFFPDEEPPFFQTDEMGSLVYAQACRAAGEEIVAMFSLETIGYFDDRPGSQAYPRPLSALYPDTGNFIGFVSNVRSRALLRDVLTVFRDSTEFPSEGASLPAVMPGVGWSDQWSFWQAGYPGLMITDSAPFRYPYYHTMDDLPKHLDFERVARIVAGMERVLRHVARGP